MQDKEFDKLFSQKLEGLEMEPSAKVWQGISENLAGKKHKKFIPYLSIAASILMLIAAGVLLVLISGRNTKSPVKKQLAAIKLQKAIPALINKQIAAAPKPVQLAVNKPARLYSYHKAVLIVRSQKREFTPGYPPPLINNPQQPAVTALTKTAIEQPVAVDTAKVLAATIPVQQHPERSGPVSTATLPPAGKTTDAVPVKKHKIHGIGDLLNVAIAAVDKRRDKIIEFSDNDGDGTSVSGVNLGIIKVKKEN